MLKVFQHYHPRKVARYVKGFYRGRFYIHGIGGFEFDGGRVSVPSHHGRAHLSAMTEINQEIKQLSEDWAA